MKDTFSLVRTPNSKECSVWLDAVRKGMKCNHFAGYSSITGKNRNYNSQKGQGTYLKCTVPFSFPRDGDGLPSSNFLVRLILQFRVFRSYNHILLGTEDDSD